MIFCIQDDSKIIMEVPDEQGELVVQGSNFLQLGSTCFPPFLMPILVNQYLYSNHFGIKKITSCLSHCFNEISDEVCVGYSTLYRLTEPNLSYLIKD